MKLKNTLIFSIIFGLAVLAIIPAESISSRVGAADDLGIGAAMGQPMGVTAKYWLSSSVAVDGMMGYHWNHNFDAHMDYLWHTFSSFNIASGRLPFYLGAGGRILLGDDSQLGLRLPVGASYLFPNDPLEFFAEIAPIVKLTSGIGLDVDGVLGVRIYINYLK